MSETATPAPPIRRKRKPKKPTRRRYILTGLVTVIPLWFTWIVLAFLFRTLSRIGNPLVQFFADRLGPMMPGLADLLNVQIFQSVVAVILVLAVLYGLGVVARHVIGRRVILFFERVIEQIPFVKTVYGAVKKLIVVLQEKPGSDVQRVVLINFPSEEMKTVGLVTRTFNDAVTGRELAAVYVPTTPNPTSGFLEVVPVEKLTSTDWDLDEAMTFIISGGAIAPDHVYYDQSAPKFSDHDDHEHDG
ncbi:MAG: putative membrane protein [Verrucomicrobiales bacterium]|jgi:uncharacterized membrane protein